MNFSISTPVLTTAAAAAAAVAVAWASPAYARTYDYFQSPSGRIGCEMITEDDGTAFATCKLKDPAWAAPSASGGDCAYPGTDLRLTQGHPACAGVWPSQIFLKQDPQYGGLPTLAYGQSRLAGSIRCESEPSGVTCTDISTGHFFRASHESYELG